MPSRWGLYQCHPDGVHPCHPDGGAPMPSRWRCTHAFQMVGMCPYHPDGGCTHAGRKGCFYEGLTMSHGMPQPTFPTLLFLSSPFPLLWEETISSKCGTCTLESFLAFYLLLA